MNLLVSQFLDFAEFQVLEQNPMSMNDWIEALDSQILALKRRVLAGSGSISHKQAITKAEKEFEIYRSREMKQLESDFDRAIKELMKKKMIVAASKVIIYTTLRITIGREFNSRYQL
ncbi:hypothetical protein CLHUN_41050 [Ruminiclostridium hungatei]|uniref:Uncharacterized protein n=1 Tax=Ruminiclostridium hungatei TaxID=48256 RepID=A0A1V4SFH0_RUMHU|nr:hypothetical protein CLHUN_41050 [Ruminiclostridium hungatei]